MEYRDVQAVRKWFALFSHTGEEIETLSSSLGRQPDYIWTNNLSSSNKKFVVPHTVATDDYLQVSLASETTEGDLVTLHGYMGIIGLRALRSGATFWNGHPGLVMMYPELAGKDPQEKFYHLQRKHKYELMGSIVHVVTPEIDRGKVISTYVENIPEAFRGKLSREAVYDKYRQLSLKAWLRALKGVV